MSDTLLSPDTSVDGVGAILEGLLSPDSEAGQSLKATTEDDNKSNPFRSPFKRNRPLKSRENSANSSGSSNSEREKGRTDSRDQRSSSQDSKELSPPARQLAPYNAAGVKDGLLRSPVPRENLSPTVPKLSKMSKSGSPKSSRPSSRTSSSVGSRTSRSSRSLLGMVDTGSTGPVLDGNIRIISSVECGGEIFALRYIETGNDVCVGLVDGTIKVVNPAATNISSVLVDEQSVKDSMPVTCIRTKPGQEWSYLIGATYASGALRLWNVETGSLMASVQEDGEMLCLSLNPHINIVAVGKGDGEIRLYDTETMKLASILTKSKNPTLFDGHTRKVFSIVNHPHNPQEFISGGWDGEIHIWDARRPHSVRRIEGPFVGGEGLDIDRKGQEILAGSWRGENQLQIFDYGSGQIVADIESERQSSYLSAVQFLGKEHVMAGGTDSSIFKIVEVKKKKSVATIRNLGNGIISLDCQKRGYLSRIAVHTETHLNILEFTK